MHLLEGLDLSHTLNVGAMPPGGASSPRLPLSEAVSNTLTVPSSRVPKAEHDAGPTLEEAELIPYAGSETEDGSEPPEAADCADMMVDLDAPLGPEPLGPEPTEATLTPEGEARGLDSGQLFAKLTEVWNELKREKRAKRFNVMGWQAEFRLRANRGQSAVGDAYLHAPDGDIVRSLPGLRRKLGVRDGDDGNAGGGAGGGGEGRRKRAAAREGAAPTTTDKATTGRGKRKREEAKEEEEEEEEEEAAAGA